MKRNQHGVSRKFRTSTSILLLAFILYRCGLLSEATTVTVDTGWITLGFDTASLGIQTNASSPNLPTIQCSNENDTCEDMNQSIQCDSAASPPCTFDCGGNGTCALHTQLSGTIPVDLSSQIQSQTQSKAIDKVNLDRINLNTVTNTLNMDLPQVSLYVGPASAASPTDPGVVLFATLPPIKSKEIKNVAIPVTDAGKAALSSFIKNYKSPFRILQQAPLTFSGGVALPQNALEIKIKAYFQVELL